MFISLLPKRLLDVVTDLGLDVLQVLGLEARLLGGDVLGFAQP